MKGYGLRKRLRESAARERRRLAELGRLQAQQPKEADAKPATEKPKETPHA